MTGRLAAFRYRGRVELLRTLWKRVLPKGVVWMDVRLWDWLS